MKTETAGADFEQLLDALDLTYPTGRAWVRRSWEALTRTGEVSGSLHEEGPHTDQVAKLDGLGYLANAVAAGEGGSSRAIPTPIGDPPLLTPAELVREAKRTLYYFDEEEVEIDEEGGSPNDPDQLLFSMVWRRLPELAAALEEARGEITVTEILAQRGGHAYPLAADIADEISQANDPHSIAGRKTFEVFARVGRTRRKRKRRQAMTS